jgi:hypothetical protein
LSARRAFSGFDFEGGRVYFRSMSGEAHTLGLPTAAATALAGILLLLSRL